MSGGKIEAVSPLPCCSGHQIQRLAEKVSSARRRLGIAAAASAPGDTPPPSFDSQEMRFEFLLEPLVDWRQRASFSINQKKAHHRLRKYRDDIRCPDLADGHFSEIPHQGTIRVPGTKGGRDTDD